MKMMITPVVEKKYKQQSSAFHSRCMYYDCSGEFKVLGKPLRSSYERKEENRIF